jgi:hypothetical protein
LVLFIRLVLLICIVEGELRSINARAWAGERGAIPVYILILFSGLMRNRYFCHQHYARFFSEEEYGFHQAPQNSHHVIEYTDFTSRNPLALVAEIPFGDYLR